MVQARFPAAGLGLLALVLFTPACGECGRRLFFFATVTDSSNAAVAGATVAVDCVDAHDGAPLSATSTTDPAGEAAPAVHAQNRDCPQDPELHAGYFQTCTITVRAAGFQEASRTLSGAALDALPEASAGQAGHGVQVTFALTRL